MRPKLSMKQVYLVSMLLLTILPVVTIGYFWVSQRYQQFEAEVGEHRAAYLRIHKQFFRDQVAQFIAYIDQQQQLVNSQLRHDLKSRTEQAYDLMATLYSDRRPLSDGERTQLLSLIVKLLGPIRFSEGRGQYVLIDTGGRILLNTALEASEHSAALETKDVDGVSVIKEAIALAKEQGEGYLQFKIKRADNDEKLSDQLTYMKYFQPLDLMIFSSEYLDDVERKLQNDIVKVITYTRFSADRLRPFILSWDGILLADPVGSDWIGGAATRLAEASTGEQFLSAHRRAASVSGGDFIEYRWPRGESKDLSHRVSFVRSYPEWKWIVGAGFSLDALDQEIAADRAALDQRVALELTYTAIGLLLTVLVAIWVAKWLARQVAEGFNRFDKFFSDSSRSSSYINIKKLPYTEFSTLAESANLMIAERARYEKALKNSEQRFELALILSRHYLWEFQEDTGSITLSNGFFELLGYTAEDFDFEQIKSVFGLCHPDDIVQLQSIESREMIKNEGLEVRLRDKFGEYRWFYSSGSMVDPEPGHTHGHRMLGIVTEITGRKNIEKELIAARISAEDANAAKSQFLATMSHELRTPLNGILGYAQLMMRDKDLSKENQQCLSSISSCGENLLAMISDILQLSKIDSSEVDLVQKECRLKDIFQEIGDISIVMAQKKGLQFSWKINSSVPENILIEAAKLKLILLNLISNAIKFTVEGWVKLEAEFEPENQKLIFVVADSGIGIAAADVKSIFEPFKQLGGLATDGPGLGLAVGRRIAETMGGELTVSSAVGEGSQFKLSVVLTSLKSVPCSAKSQQEFGNYSAEPKLTVRRKPVAIDDNSLAQLRNVAQVGDIEMMKLMMESMLKVAKDSESRHWLQAGLQLLEQFDLESIRQMINDFEKQGAVR